jgi:cytochrome c-type biogenesis protein CcmH/NrfG
MSKEKNSEIKYVPINTALIVAFVCLVVGFLVGVVYSTYKAGTESTIQQSAFQPTLPGQTANSAQQANMILALEKKVAEDPSHMESWLQLGNLYFDTNNPQRAITAYKKYLELDPNNPDVWTDLGVMYRRNGRAAEAIVAFDKAIELNPTHAQSWFNKGIVLMHDQNNPEAAIKAWEELVKIAPNFRATGDQTVQDMIDDLKKTVEVKKD